MKSWYLYFRVFFIILCSVNIAFADIMQQDEEKLHTSLVDNSGQDKIVYIMSQIQHDIVPGYNHHVAYAHISNLDIDLNITEIARFFNCKTFMGNEFLKESLSLPISAADQSGLLELRKNIIMQLVNNPDLKQQVEDVLQTVALHEKAVVELMSDTFKGEHCPSLKASTQIKKSDNPNLILIDKIFNSEEFATALYLMNLSALSHTLYRTYEHGKLAFKDDYVETFSACLCTAGSLWSLYNEYKLHVKTYKKREALHALYRLIYGAEKIAQLSDDYDMPTQFSINLITDCNAREIINGLKAWRYQNQNDYIVNIPAIITFLYKVYENEEHLAQIFRSIAEIDACNAIATKILESKTSQRKFCFSQKIESIQPQCNAVSFWNILVPNAVVNNLFMDQNIILTGPNAGGKSTLIRANVQNIVLSQTFHIAAAAEFAWTPFDIILSYLVISDDLMQGDSLFACEIKRAQNILEWIRTLVFGQKLFFVIDELFTGTSAAQGEKCAYEFIKKIAGFDQALFIYATHFDKLKELGDQNIGLMNYKVDAPVKNNDGKFVYPFTLSAGASSINIAVEMAQDAGLFE